MGTKELMEKFKKEGVMPVREFKESKEGMLRIKHYEPAKVLKTKLKYKSLGEIHRLYGLLRGDKSNIFGAIKNKEGSNFKMWFYIGMTTCRVLLREKELYILPIGGDVEDLAYFCEVLEEIFDLETEYEVLDKEEVEKDEKDS